jgi:outer membrane lipoprotein-sorting protein
LVGSTGASVGIQTNDMRRVSGFFPAASSAAPLLLALCFVSAAGAQEPRTASANSQGPKLNLEQVLTRLEEHNAQRAAELEQFDSKRVYRMQYHGLFKERDAEMVVKVHFNAPNTKEFTIISQSGSKFVIDHVFKKLLDAEQEAGHNRRECALSRENYRFSLEGYELTPQGPQYVLTLQPKSNNKFLYRGKIWVDAKDFAVARIEGEPNRNPSMWITKTDFAHQYTKVDDFWLPAKNETETSVRFGGKSRLSIEYQDYKITKASPLHITETARINRLAMPVSASTPDE